MNNRIARDIYGCNEVNVLSPEMAKERESIKRMLDWTSKELKTIERLRLLSDPGFAWWDVSYCYGRTHGGELVDVQLPFSQLSKRQMRKEIVEHAKRDNVFAVGLDIFNAISTLN